MKTPNGLLVCGKWLPRGKPEKESLTSLPIPKRTKPSSKAKLTSNIEPNDNLPLIIAQIPPLKSVESTSLPPCEVEEWQDSETGERGFYFPAFDILCNLKGEPILYNVKKQQFIHQLFAERMVASVSTLSDQNLNQGGIVQEPDDSIESMGPQLEKLQENAEMLESFRSMFEKLQLFENMKLEMLAKPIDAIPEIPKKNRPGRPAQMIVRAKKVEKDSKGKKLEIPQHLKPYAIRENLAWYNFPALEDILNAYEKEFTCQEMSELFDRFQSMHQSMEYIWYPYGWQFLDKEFRKPVDYVCKFIKEEETAVRIKRNFIVTWYEKLGQQVFNPVSNTMEDAYEKKQLNFDKKNKDAALFFCKKVGILYNTVFGQIPAQLFRTFGVKVGLDGKQDFSQPVENRFTYFFPWKLYCRRVPSNPKKHFISTDQDQLDLPEGSTPGPLLIEDNQTITNSFLRPAPSNHHSTKMIEDAPTPSYIPPSLNGSFLDQELLGEDEFNPSSLEVVAYSKHIPTLSDLENLPCKECECVHWIPDPSQPLQEESQVCHQWVCSDCFVRNADIDIDPENWDTLYRFCLDHQYPQFQTKVCEHSQGLSCTNCVYYANK
jgi:hypothetical protein